MDRCEDVFTRREGDLSDSSSSAASTSTSPTTSPSPSPSPSPPNTRTWSSGTPSKCPAEAFKLSARVKCTRCNTAAMLDEALIHDAADFTVDDTAASLAEHREAQCQQLLDLFGYVELPDPVALADPMVQKRSPAIGLPFGTFVGINTCVGREFYANAGVRIHDRAPVAIGRHVRLGPNVSLLTEGHAMDAEERMRGVVVARPIEIGGDVWIRAGVSVLGGVKIGNRGRTGGLSGRGVW